MPNAIVDVSSRTFSDLSLPAPLIKALTNQGIVTPTPVQDAVIPDALTEFTEWLR